MSGKEDELLDSPHIGGKKMSSSLKNRLRRSSRSFSSPVLKSGASSAQVKDCNLKECWDSQDFECYDMNSLSLEDIEKYAGQDFHQIQKMHYLLKKQMMVNSEKLKKLEQVENYSLNKKLHDFESLIQKWLTASQESLQKLHAKLSESNVKGFPDLLIMLNINPDDVQYDSQSDAFYK